MPDEQPKRRSIDERLDAITQTLELVAGMQQANEREITELRISVQDLKAAVQIDAENIRALARIAEIHERRLSDLEPEQ